MSDVIQNVPRKIIVLPQMLCSLVFHLLCHEVLQVMMLAVHLLLVVKSKMMDEGGSGRDGLGSYLTKLPRAYDDYLHKVSHSVTLTSTFIHASS